MNDANSGEGVSDSESGTDDTLFGQMHSPLVALLVTDSPTTNSTPSPKTLLCHHRT